MNEEQELELKKHLQLHTNWPSLPHDEKVRFLTLGLCGEVGELANLIKKDWRGDAPDNLWEKMVDEMADIGNYLYMLFTIVAPGTDIRDKMLDKLILVEQRPTYKGDKV
jgi:NTP pyrophosphatase (non-canonical NTP hydrolase)